MRQVKLAAETESGGAGGFQCRTGVDLAAGKESGAADRIHCEITSDRRVDLTMDEITA
jgi:hypothetical protein